MKRIKNKEEILNRISLKKHKMHFNQIPGMTERALILNEALEETINNYDFYIRNPITTLEEALKKDENLRKIVINWMKDKGLIK